MSTGQSPPQRIKAPDPAVVAEIGNVPLITPRIRLLLRRLKEEGALRVAQDSSLGVNELQLLSLMIAAQETPQRGELCKILLQRYQSLTASQIMDAIRNAVSAQVADRGGAGHPIPTQYLVRVTNYTNAVLPPGVIFEEVTFFYKRIGLPGVVFLTQGPVLPNSTVVFTLGACWQMESYAWGAWAYVEIDGVLQYIRVASVPADPEHGDPPMTPTQRNLVENPVEPCADGYVVGP